MEALFKDSIYVNPEITKIASFKINETFKSYSELIDALFPDYIIDDKDHTIVAKQDTKTVRFS